MKRNIPLSISPIKNEFFEFTNNENNVKQVVLTGRIILATLAIGVVVEKGKIPVLPNEITTKERFIVLIDFLGYQHGDQHLRFGVVFIAFSFLKFLKKEIRMVGRIERQRRCNEAIGNDRQRMSFDNAC